MKWMNLYSLLKPISVTYAFLKIELYDTGEIIQYREKENYFHFISSTAVCPLDLILICYVHII